MSTSFFVRPDPPDGGLHRRVTVFAGSDAEHRAFVGVLTLRESEAADLEVRLNRPDGYEGEHAEVTKCLVRPHERVYADIHNHLRAMHGVRASVSSLMRHRRLHAKGTASVPHTHDTRPECTADRPAGTKCPCHATHFPGTEQTSPGGC